MRRARLVDHLPRDEQGGDADGQIDQEDRTPAHTGRQHAAEDRAECRRNAGDRTPRAEGDAAFTAVEGRREKRERRREQHRAADTLQCAGHDQHDRVLCDAAEQRAECEDHQTDREDSTSAELVGDRSGCQQQRGQRERIRVGDPLQLTETGAECMLNVGKCDDDDRDVEQQHECRRADDDKRPPFTFHECVPFEDFARIRCVNAPQAV